MPFVACEAPTPSAAGWIDRLHFIPAAMSAATAPGHCRRGKAHALTMDSAGRPFDRSLWSERSAHFRRQVASTSARKTKTGKLLGFARKSMRKSRVAVGSPEVLARQLLASSNASLRTNETPIKANCNWKSRMMGELKPAATEDGQATSLALEVVGLAMTPNHWYRTSLIGLIGLCTACGCDRTLAKSEPADTSLPAIRIAENEPTLPFNDVELSLVLTSHDTRGLPKEIRITFRNKSSKRGCLVFPRPVIEGEDDASLPCLCVGMREMGNDDLLRGEPVFLYTKPHGQPAGPREGAYLDAGAKISRTYDLSSFCLIGHGIGPKPNANFSSCYHPGDQESELRAYLITKWANLTRISSNPILVRTSELDFSVRLKLDED